MRSYKKQNIMEQYILSIKYRIGESNVKKQLVFGDYDIAYKAMMDNFDSFAKEHNINPNGKEITMISKSGSHLDCWQNDKFSYFSDITHPRRENETPMDYNEAVR